MRRILIILLLSVSVAFSAAGRTAMPVVRIGIKAGAMVQQYSIDGTIYGLQEQLEKPHVGLFGGFSTRTTFSDLPLFIQAELLGEIVTLTGGSNPDYADRPIKLKMRALTFPVLAGVSIETGYVSSLNISAGPVLNLMSDASADMEDSHKADLLLRRPTISWAAGIAVEFGRWNIDARFSFYPGTNRVEPDPQSTVELTSGGSVSLAASYLF